MIHTTQLHYKYPTGRSFVFPDIICNKGESLLITGPSGSGKSTLLHLLCGLIKPDIGSIHIMQTDLTKLSKSKTDKFRGSHIGVMLQKSYFLNSLNVLENLKIFQYINKNMVDIKHAVHLLTELGLGQKLKHKTVNLSQGESQRLNFARALINSPALILADEPTSALDDHHTDLVIEMLKLHAANLNAALIIVTHDQRIKSQFNQQLSLQ